MAATQTPPSALRVLEFIDECDGIEVVYAGGRFTFTIVGTPPQIVTWDVDPADLSRAAVRLNRSARAAFGRSHAGWNLLLVHLEEALRTSTATRGHLELTDGAQLRVTTCPP
ncbi:hypothetical protein [Ruania alba]|uniref:Uncharacterized protein n=1 Tax=Ruania alba TaxID=648782 RepID=A0A1H5HXN4_9MICO|nr:hypothetical protein [Ruania alba]SEE32411.1 hypothetical protein SAMN04488554_2092 [Ruania alba]